MHRVKLIGVVVLMQLFSGSGFGQALSEEFSIDFIDVRKGLLSNYVTKTISDEDNIKYFATEGGVSKYDGYDFSDYRPGKEHPGLKNENIETLLKDASNNIWIGTKGGGLSVLLAKTNTFKSFNHVFEKVTAKKLRVISLAEDKDGNIWLGTWAGGVFVLDPHREVLLGHYELRAPVYEMIRDRFHSIWFISGWTLFKAEAPGSVLVRTPTKFQMFNIVEDSSRNCLWLVGNHGNEVKLYRFDYQTQAVKLLNVNLKAHFIKSAALDSKNRLWLGSWGDGLYISDPDVARFERINTTPGRQQIQNPSHSMILDIDIDRNGIAWLATAHGGVLILYPNKGFTLMRLKHGEGSRSDKAVKSDQNVTSIHKDKAGRMYWGTLTSGLFVERRDGVISKVETIPDSKVYTIYEKGRFLFVGTSLGLYVIKDGDLSDARLFFPNEKVTSVLVDSRNRIWIGTQQRGLRITASLDDPASEKVKVYSEDGATGTLNNNRVSQIKEDSEGRIWVSTYSGLNLYDETKDAFIDHSGLLDEAPSMVIINDLHLSQGRIFIGTPTGLGVLKYTGGNLNIESYYDRTNGLSNDFVSAIEEDSAGDLWLTSTTSIIKYQRQTGTFVNYDREDGVMVNSFHIASSFSDASGHVYFGGSDGMISLHPKSVSEEFNVPQIVFTKIIVNNKELAVGEAVSGEVVLKESIQRTDRIELGHMQNHLSLEFAANDFLGAENISYAYKMVGFGDEWVSIGPKNEISFTGLSHGSYKLLVKASRNNRDWSDAKAIDVVIAAPPWLTGYAFTGYILLLVGILVLVRHISTRQARLKAELKIVQIQKDKEHELNEEKITFFTNISHEFRTPLTLILSPVTELKESSVLENSARERLTLVETNARRLLNLVNQLLDFRKSEHGLLKLKLTHSDFVAFAREVFSSFRIEASKKKVSYEFETDVPECLADFDRGQMEIVLCNLLSNALKYTRSGGNVTLIVEQLGDRLRARVSDTGIGISSENTSRIFSRFFQVQGSETAGVPGSGIGLSFSKNIIELHGGSITFESERHAGSSFIFEIPCSSKAASVEPSTDPVQVSFPTAAPPRVIDFPKQKLEQLPQKQRSATVLVVDDNEDIRDYLKKLLQNDYEILEAPDGLEAIGLINREMPDLVISDVMMPNMDGIHLCREVKGQLATSHIPILLLTARASLDFEIAGLQTGADDYITKPFNAGVVLTKVKNILDNRRKLREYYLKKVRFEPDLGEVRASNVDSEFIERAIKLVNDNIQNENFGIETMVDQLFMSQSTLFRKVKSLTGLSLTGFVRSVKLKKAAQLILESDLKLSNIARDAGFNDYKYFKKSFEQQFGCLPSEYKEKVLQESK